MIDLYELAELRRSVGNRIGGYANAFRAQGNRALRVLPSFYAGQPFTDTIAPGRYYPFKVGLTGGVVINTSATNPTSIAFHNTGASVSDMLVTQNASGSLFILPSSATSVNQALVVGDRSPGNYLGHIFYPAQLSGGTTQPQWNIVSPTNTSNVIYRFETNYPQFLGAAAGVTPAIYVLGTDVNIGMNLVPKGTGGFQVGDMTARNGFLLSPGASGSPAVVNAVGVDTNIDLRLFPKGTGLIDFAIGSTALGGGAGASLGTIGGTGPTAAGQAYWIALKISGTKVWFPVWI